MPEETPSKTMKRRGILAAAGAVVAGIVAKQTSLPVAASSGGGDQGYLALGSNPWYLAGIPLNTNNQAAVSAEPTVIQASPNFNNYAGGNGGHRVLLEVDASTNTSTSGGNRGITGIHAVGYGDGDGVDGHSTSGYGVYGDSPITGVYGQGIAGVNGAHGVKGQVNNGTVNNTIGVIGLTFATGTGNVGVYGAAENGGVGVQGYGTTGVQGSSDFDNGTGVSGSSTGGIGVYGGSTGGYGVLGISSKVGFASISGITTTANVPAFNGGSTTPSALAAYFNGGIYVDCTTAAGGQFVVNPMTAKSGLLKHPDGSHRLMYSVEAPESWAEDVGTGNLVGGKATVKLDPDFAAVIHTDNYHVFLTMYDTPQALCVTDRTASGFTVQAEKAGASGAFSWRVMATPKTDKKVARLGKYDIPAPLHLPTKDELPKAAPLPPVGKTP